MSVEERRKLGIEDFCPKRKRTGKNPTITGCGKKNNKEERWECWLKPERTPENEEIKKMVAEALGIAMKTILKTIYLGSMKKLENNQVGGGRLG